LRITDYPPYAPPPQPCTLHPDPGSSQQLQQFGYRKVVDKALEELAASSSPDVPPLTPPPPGSQAAAVAAAAAAAAAAAGGGGGKADIDFEL